jgi:hypothetical protein
LRLLDRILRSLDRNHPQARDKEQRESLFADLAAAFATVSLGEERTRAALEGFARALDQIVAAPAELGGSEAFNVGSRAAPLLPTDDGSSDLLEMLLQPGSWFLVHDNDRDEPRWMKAVAYYSGLDCGAFAEFDGGNTLILKSRVLLDDLSARRTIPVDLGPAAKEAFERFLARAA